MKYVMYLNLLLITLSSIFASDQQKRLHNAIASCNIADLVVTLEGDSQKTKKDIVKKLVDSEIERRKQAAKSIFYSTGDLANLGKAAACAWAGYQLFKAACFGFDLHEEFSLPAGAKSAQPGFEFRMKGLAIAGKSAVNWLKAGLAMLELKPELIKNQIYVYDTPLFKSEKRKMYQQIPELVTGASWGLAVSGTALMCLGVNKFADAIQKKDAQEKLKKVRALQSYIQRLN